MARPRVQVVPVRGLPLVALVLVGVVVAIARDARWGLVFCHVVGGGLWTAIDLFVGFIGLALGRILQVFDLLIRQVFDLGEPRIRR